MQFRKHIITISALIALVLQITPMPAAVDLYRPDWVLLVLAYWTMALPNRVNVGVAFINGLVLDILLGTVLGVHSFALCLAIYVISANYKRLRNFSVWQQAMIIGVVSALYHLVVFWLQHLLTDVVFRIDFLWPVATSMVLWPWLFWLLRKMRRQFRIT